MKIQYTLLACGMLFLMGMASCEMKEELIPGNNDPEEKGLLQIGVSYNKSITATQTKAEEAPVDADGFKVEITNSDLNYNKTFTYNTGEPLSVELPVATYKVYAHSDLEKQTYMTEPYYGQEQSIEIKAQQTVDVDMLCKMENTKIALVYDPEFLSTFSKCQITITAGNCARSFSYDKSVNIDVQNPAPEYWMLEEGVTTITVTAVGWTTEGNVRVSQSYDYHKEDNSAYEGSDAITFTMHPTADNSGSTTIGVTVNLFEEVEGDTVEVPVEEEETSGEETDTDEPGNPDPGTGKLTMEVPEDIVFSIKDETIPSDAEIKINAPAGMKSLKVIIKSGNPGFRNAISALVENGLDFITEGVEVVDNDKIGIVLKMFLPESDITAPEQGATSYSFPVGAFFGLMKNFGATTERPHTFEVTLEDMNGEKLEDSLKVTINE